MRADDLRLRLSRYFDHDLDPAEAAEVEELLASSPQARLYLKQLESLRRELRYEPADSPDVTRSVMAEVTARPKRRGSLGRRVAAAMAAGMVGGAVFIGLALRQPAPIAAAEIPEQVLAAQSEVTSLTASLELVERGWHPEVPERAFVGQISYRAPESLWVEVRDETRYPSPDWVPNHSTLVVDEDVAWSRFVAPCPTEVLPECTVPEPRVLLTVGREPFPDVSPAPLDLIVPVSGFSRASEPGLVGRTSIDARRAVGVEVTAAQVAALLDGLTAGNLRDVHPTDRVELWLDEDALVPLALSVYPAPGQDRALWAVRHGYDDQPDIPIFEARWTDVSLDDGAPPFPQPPTGTPGTEAGFGEGVPPLLASLETALPEGVVFHRAGTVATGPGPEVSVASWSDGRAWIKMRWTEGWQGDCLFGDMGGLVRQAPAGTGVAYLNEQGDRLAIHGDQIDLVITGSFPTEVLLGLAQGLGIEGQTVPDHWAEAATATIAEAAAEVPGLVVPVGLTGFTDPAIRIGPGLATVAYAGPGNRGFQLTVAGQDRLSPPLEADVRGVRVRGVDGRYSPGRGVLEWVEGEVTITLASTTLTLDELVGIAGLLGAP